MNRSRRQPTAFGWFLIVSLAVMVLLEVSHLVGLGRPPNLSSYILGAIGGVVAAWLVVQLFAVDRREIVGVLALAVVFLASFAWWPWDLGDGFRIALIGTFIWIARRSFSRPPKGQLYRDLRDLRGAVEAGDDVEVVAFLAKQTPETRWSDVELASHAMFDRDPSSLAWRPLFVAIDQRRSFEGAWNVAAEAALLRPDDPGPAIALARLCSSYCLQRSETLDAANRAWELRDGSVLPSDAAALGFVYAHIGGHPERVVELMRRAIDGGVVPVTQHVVLAETYGRDTDEGRRQTRAAMRAAGIWSLGQFFRHRRDVEASLTAPFRAEAAP